MDTELIPHHELENPVQAPRSVKATVGQWSRETTKRTPNLSLDLRLRCMWTHLS